MLYISMMPRARSLCKSLLSAQLTEVSDNVQRMQAVVSLYSAIGGGRE